MLLGGTAASAWSVAVRAQQRVRRIAIMLPSTENDPETQARIAAFRQGLEQFGWQEGRNIRFEYRWPAGNPELIKTSDGRTCRFSTRCYLGRDHSGGASA